MASYNISDVRLKYSVEKENKNVRESCEKHEYTHAHVHFEQQESISVKRKKSVKLSLSKSVITFSPFLEKWQQTSHTYISTYIR